METPRRLFIPFCLPQPAKLRCYWSWTKYLSKHIFKELHIITVFGRTKHTKHNVVPAQTNLQSLPALSILSQGKRMFLLLAPPASPLFPTTSYDFLSLWIFLHLKSFSLHFTPAYFASFDIVFILFTLSSTSNFSIKPFFNLIIHLVHLVLSFHLQVVWYYSR